MHRAVAGFSSTALDVTQLGQRQGGSFTFTCKRCKRVEFLVRELAELKEMLVGMKRAFMGHGLEEKGGETGDRGRTGRAGEGGRIFGTRQGRD